MQIILKSERFKSTVILSLIFMLLVSFSFSPIVNATEITSEEIKMKQELDMFFNEVVYIDENGVEQIDFNQMEKLFGKEQTENVKLIEASAEQAKLCDNPIIQSKAADSIQSRAATTVSFSSCMKEALLDYLGVSAVQAMLTGGVWYYLTQKAWKEAAELAVRLGIGTNAVALAATFIYYGGKCAYKYGI